MKIGILTFHSQLNYGGVLQCWALKTALETFGHQVVVIDRWLDRSNAALRGVFVGGLPSWCKFAAKVLLRWAGVGHLVRIKRTREFVNGLGLTPYHFKEWDDAPTELGVDVVVVGSDQVWNPNWDYTRAYLMEGITGVRKIAYATSFGVEDLPETKKELYGRALGEFEAISCREQEGVAICRKLGCSAVHVVDPTLLLEPSQWEKLCKDVREDLSCRKLVCYFMDVDLIDIWPLLERFARRMNCTVEIMVNRSTLHRAIPVSRHVKIRFEAGPIEFVSAFRSADWVVTDSFHAVMFASIFNKNARFVMPKSQGRKRMFARVSEFTKECINGCFLAQDVGTALESIERGESVSFNRAEISAKRMTSMKWIESVLQ